MDDFPGLLARDFGYKPQGKSAPMAPPRNNNSSAAARSSIDFDLLGLRSSSTKSAPSFDGHDHRGRAADDGFIFNDVLGGPPRSAESRAGGGTAGSGFDYDSIFKEQKNAKSSSLPIFDKPVYDDDVDIFEGLPGVKSASNASTNFDDLFSAPSPKKRSEGSSPFDHLLDNLGKKDMESKVESSKVEKDSPVFDDLLAGFDHSSSPGISRSTSGSSQQQQPTSNSAKVVSSVIDDPFVVLESTSTPVNSSADVFTDPLEEINNFGSAGNPKVDSSSSRAAFDDMDFLGRTVPPVSPENNKGGIDTSPLGTGDGMDDSYSSTSKEPVDKYHVDNAEGYLHRKTPIHEFRSYHEVLFDMPTASTNLHGSVGQNASPPSYENDIPNDMNPFTRSEEVSESSDDIRLTVSEVPLFTQPTSAPPPSRPPPPKPALISKSRSSSFASSNTRMKVNEYSSFSSTQSQSLSSAHVDMSSATFQVDELEDFAMGRTRNNVNADTLSSEDLDTSAAAAAMKDAVDKAEAKIRQWREKDHLKTVRSKETGPVDKDMIHAHQRESRERHERLDYERLQREREEGERERERTHQMELEEKERERRRLEHERERAKDLERERARQAVERATREARERAAAEARIKAERAAVQRAHAEARERAAAEAREKAEKAAAEARERANAEARERAAAASKAESDARRRAERAAVERAASEARERAAAEARERAAAAARTAQQKTDDDLESFFQSRASSAPRPRTNSVDPFFDNRSKGGPEVAKRTSVGSTSSMKKASSTANIVDDLSAIFGAAASAGEFQEVEGESDERRRARLERNQRTQERAAKALAEKNERDLQAQRDQAERHRIAETLDVEIKRWAAGKEGNLRALLSTLQYVLWPQCGWQPVSLTDLITAAAVKKLYRKATLCIHPDKVQQKGANLQQKYVAEKVFDLLKEAWNKFNSEELF